MIAIAIPFPFPYISGYRGESKEAILVGERSQETQDRLQESIALGLVGKGTFQELEEVSEECSAVGWDGEEASPISREVMEYTEVFLRSLPLGIEAPKIGAEPDGAITLEWYRNPTRVLSISINPDGWVYYAALIVTSRRHGVDYALSGIDDELLGLISRVTNGS